MMAETIDREATQRVIDWMMPLYSGGAHHVQNMQEALDKLAGELAAGSFYKEADIDALMARAENAEAERDRFEAALARACLVGGTTYLIERAEKAEAERDSFRAVLEGAQYGDIDGIARNSVEQSRALGQTVMRLTIAKSALAETAEVSRLRAAPVTLAEAAKVLADLLEQADDMHPQLEQAVQIAAVMRDAEQTEELIAALRRIAGGGE